MRIQNINQLNDFIRAVKNCKGMVWLVSPEGDKFNLKSEFSRYVALGELLSQRGEDLELFCANQADEGQFFSFLDMHPEV